jgi:hypothetical protein
MRASCCALNFDADPPTPPPPEVHPFASRAPPRARSFFARSAIAGVIIAFGGKTSLWHIF